MASQVTRRRGHNDRATLLHLLRTGITTPALRSPPTPEKQSSSRERKREVEGYLIPKGEKERERQRDRPGSCCPPSDALLFLPPSSHGRKRRRKRLRGASPGHRKVKPPAEEIEPAEIPTRSAPSGSENGGRRKSCGEEPALVQLQDYRAEEDEELTGDCEAYMASVLAKYRRNLVERTKHHLGYPYNLDFEYGALSQLQPFSINNLGDPFIESNYGVHSRQFEVGVLDWFARLWELEKNEYWGYITNCGTEGNLHGILIGREVFPDGVLYASRESHYSVFKAARMYRMDCVKVKTLVSGEIDCSDFQAKLIENQEKPAIVNVNIGTTVKGAVDDLDLVIKLLEESGFENRFYIHCDGALFGLMMPFVKRAPKVTFRKPIGSVSVSGHKFIGCPVPCGVQITRKTHINAVSRDVEYLASRDATIMGSRNGHAPLFLWYALNRKGYRGFQKEVQRHRAMLNELSSTVVFERPQDDEFVRKWQLACEGNIAHVVVMPNVTVEKLCVFVDELVRVRSVWSSGGEISPPCIAAEVAARTATVCFTFTASNGVTLSS
ncbi:unnamed protein product [Spirodela intermedia]|uniref:Histidine decarboxylase n=1 Tax=Spirodela intermedia TaxID=51605 RepID=A0ABN7ECG8_SPIIN|nr:unnamed protein product [Spirodela intermedia]